MSKETIYTSNSQLANPRLFLRELLADLRGTKELGWRLFITNLRSQYRQSVLGYLWLLVPPILTSFIWILLSRFRVINTNTDANIYPVFVVSGIFIWQSFVDVIDMPIRQLNSQRAILTKVRAPHEAFILAGLGEVVFNLVLRMGLLLVMLFAFQVGISITLLLVPIGLFSVLLLGLSIGLALTPIGMLYQDISNGLRAFVSLWFFMTPIIYQLPAESGVGQILKYNPVTPLLVTTRNWVINGQLVPEEGFLVVSAIAFVLMIFSLGFYRLAKPHILARLAA